MAEDVLKIPGELDLDRKRAAAEYRRCILLLLLASTSPNNPTLKKLLADGLLATIKSWLDDTLNGAIGSTDLLLHLLSSITDLPVTKSQVVSSGMGKAIRDIDKHKICAGSSNEAAIKTRVKAVKDAWNSSVKVNKDPDRKKKRPLQSSTSQSPTKKKKVDSSFSSLVKKAATSPKGKTDDDGESNVSKATAAWAAGSGSNGSSNGAASKTSNRDDAAPERKAAPKKPAKRVKWIDHFGGKLDNAEGHKDDAEGGSSDGKVSWSDRKKRDRLREKELLANAKKAKIIDDDDDDEDTFGGMSISRMKPTMPWHEPKQLPVRNDVTKPHCVSKEVAIQAERKTRVAPVRYLSEEDVPSNPAPMTDAEHALDVANRAAAAIASIPFFAAQQAPVAAPVPAPAPMPAQPMYPQPTTVPTGFPPPPPPPMTAPPVGAGGTAATAEMLQAMGLPLFLVGSNVHALQTLAQTPSLLNTFIAANGQYDQPRLLNLVQALTQNLPPHQQIQQQPTYQQPATASMSYGMPQQQTYQATPYGAAPVPAPSPYGPQGTTTTTAFSATPAPAAGFRGSSDAGNLHVSGYGPGTTESDIMTLFAPYVRPYEVIMKSTFSFVNTHDPEGANRAREALNGTMLGGLPIRINPATRRNPSSAPGFSSAHPPIAPVAPAPVKDDGQVDYDSIRDDRGNPATKNLFVAGFGLGATEQQIRDHFSQYCTVTGCVLKGTFAFVNTPDRATAVKVREILSGTPLNGGNMRINFAKESGRLGTSFDTTYGPNSASHQQYMRR